LFPGGQPDELDHFAGFLARHGGVLVAQEGAGHDIGEHRHRAKRLCDLKRPGYAMRADIMRPQAHDLAPIGQHRPGVGPVKPGDQVKARGLAGAIRADQCHGFILLDGKADILHGAQPAEAFAQSANHQRFCHGRYL